MSRGGFVRGGGGGIMSVSRLHTQHCRKYHVAAHLKKKSSLKFDVVLLFSQHVSTLGGVFMLC